MKKSKKTRKTQKKCRLLIDKISKWKVIFSLFLMISSCKTTKKKETFVFFFFFYKFFSRLFIQESRKICVQAGILNPFASLTFLLWFIYMKLVKVGSPLKAFEIFWTSVSYTYRENVMCVETPMKYRRKKQQKTKKKMWLFCSRITL